MTNDSSVGIIEIAQSSNILRLAIYMKDRVASDHSNFPLLCLVRMFIYCLENTNNSVIIGSVGIQYVSPEEMDLGYRLGVHYSNSNLDVYKGIRIRREKGGWFFKEYPTTLLDKVNFESLIDNDSLCVLVGYRGPNEIFEILDGLDDEASDFEISACLLNYCDAIVLPLDDGDVLGAYVKTDALELTTSL